MTAATTDHCVGAALFTDLVGFTEYNDAVGDVAALQVLNAQTAMAEHALQYTATDPDCCPGRLVKELGDGLMFWFESAAHGLEAAAALLDQVGHARTTGEFPLAIRMGIHHGAAMNRGTDVVGQTINIAARVSALAGPNELLISETVLHAADSISLPLAHVGPVRVKGVAEPVWLHRLDTDQS